MRGSKLPAGGTNIFQQIKAQKAEAKAKGIKIIDLSIGQPTGPALESARKACAKAVMSDDQAMHEYQDNVCIMYPHFASRFVRSHIKSGLFVSDDNIDFLPIPGMKPMLPLVILACGLDTNVKVKAMTRPGYPVPATWCQYLNRQFEPLLTTPENEFLFPAESIGDANLVMMNYPHNPSGQVSNWDYLWEICGHCDKHGIRVFNDAAYTILAGEDHTTLTDVALRFPNLSWAEAFSSSKAGNFTGWRVGAIIGSSDFIADIRSIKGNTDSGFFAPAAIGIDEAFRSEMPEIIEVSAVYARRIKTLVDVLGATGMKLAVMPKAGFFTLWMSPKRAFSEELANANEFNELMIARTGIVGVPFDPYIRYAVVGDINLAIGDIARGFREALGP